MSLSEAEFYHQIFEQMTPKQRQSLNSERFEELTAIREANPGEMPWSILRRYLEA